MDLSITDGICIDFTSMYIDIPVTNWTPKFSYLVCRGLVDNGILPGKAVIGMFRKRVFDSFDKERPDGYTVVYSNYAWIDAGEDGLIDPCNWNHAGTEKTLLQVERSDAYFCAVDPLNISNNDLPAHYISDELYPIPRGLHKETFNRLLNFKIEVAGLTMVEAAYLARSRA
ncbi:hypothetical protein Xvie_03896 [Xenorhabdus vietnamensis]|uniref:Uncharacterized protein n=1 Tax=Xenorhabdus vietnamensis TaxID=351656 RepID=A0A1Y2S6G5_9GAMM|nr:hypothetical protein [Xenorhabdus vietnamensis]OTA14238.1 hypothetical protein Xvie_03896 [Xenorhabdus vietnamensis]UVN17698.1 hypothetical protein pXVIEV2_003 [Xenorhabdus vietnamensis]